MAKKRKKNEHDLVITKTKLELNQSGINMYLRCPESFRRRYLDGDVIPPGIAAACGSGVHRAAQYNFDLKRTTGNDARLADVVDVGVQSLRQDVKDFGVYLTADEESIGKDKVMNEAERKVQSLTTLFRNEVAPPIQPRLVEHKHEFLLPSGVTVRATLDCATTDRRVVELKTKAKAGNFRTYEMSVQTTMYHMLDALVEGTPPEAVVVEELIDTKVPKRQTFTIQKNRDDYEALLNQVDAVAKAVRSGVFTGAYGQKDAWWCSPDRCGYWHSCPFVPKYKR